MRTQESALGTGAAGVLAEKTAFPPQGTCRLLVMGGISLILLGMLFGDIFAVFVLHQNVARISDLFSNAINAVATGQAGTIPGTLQGMGALLENRGTKVDTHVHMVNFGYLALMLAVLQPYVWLSEQWKKRLAWLLVLGSGLLPVAVFLIHYVGLTYSPFQSLGWASVFADLGGLFVLIAVVGQLVGLWRYVRRESRNNVANELLQGRSWAARTLLVGGTLLILAGFIHGAYYAKADLYQNEGKDAGLLSAMTSRAAENNRTAAAHARRDYDQLQGAKAVNIAAHAHVIDLGLLAFLLAFFQPYVFLSERWKRIWAVVLLLGSALLPVFVLLELRLGLFAGGIADIAGLLVIAALVGMLVGVLRHTGRLDAATGLF